MTLTSWLLAGMMASSGADLATTTRATRAGARELNPVFTSPQTLVIGKAAIGTGQVLLLSRWAKKHPKLVRAMAIGSTVAYAGMAVHNVRVMRRQR